MTRGLIAGWLEKIALHQLGQMAAPARRRPVAAVARALHSGATRWHLDPLEPRTLLSALLPSNYEQYMVQLVNFARSDPVAYAASLGISLNEGLPAGTISSTPKQPLAINPFLVQSAASHSQWMLDTDTFSHTGINGSTPGNRMTSAGYTFTGNWTWGENIGWRGASNSIPDVTVSTKLLEEGLFTDLDIPDRGHRINLMNDAFREVGVGIRTGTFETYNAVMITQDFAASGSKIFLTGAVYNDFLVQTNSFYDPGEGLGGVTITATSGNNVYQTTTWASGGYVLALPPGTYQVVAQGGDFSGTSVCDITISSKNVEADFLSGISYASVNFETPDLASTFTTLTTSPGAITYGNSVTLTALVSAGAGSPTGSVAFYDGATPLGTATINSSTGIATLAGSNFTAGSHSLTAYYFGTSTFAGSTSGASILTVNKAPLTVTADPQSKIYGQANPVLTGTLTGVLGSDDITATYSTAATTFSHPGTFVITPTLHDPNGRLNNYNVTKTSSTLTIIKAQQIISWSNPAAIPFGTLLSAQQLNAAVTGVPGGSAPSALTYSPVLGTMLDVGTQTLTVSAAATADYNAASGSITLTVTLPDKPVNISPANGVTNLSLTPTLTVSPYSIPPGVTQAASQWLITRVVDGASIWDSGTDIAHALTTTVPADTLTYDTQYAWQFRFQDTEGLWSAYSSATTFTTFDPAPETPVNSLPADNATGQSIAPTLSAGPFTALDTDSHAASQWIITRLDGTPVWNSGAVSDLTSITVPANKLAPDTPYRWQVRYLDSDGLWSDFSSPTTFRTSPAHLAILQQPRGVFLSARNTTDLLVAVVDDFNNVVASSSTTINLALSDKPRGGTLAGITSAAVVNGVARFSYLLFSTSGTYTLQAAGGSFAPILSDPISATYPPARLAFLQKPATTIAGQTIISTSTVSSVLQVAVLDSKGHIVAADSSTVTISLKQLSATLHGTLTAPVIDGIATFSDLSINTSGKYSLKATDGLLKSTLSRTFTVTPDLATAHLVWDQEPATLVGKTFSPKLMVQALDQFGNLVTTDRSTILLSCSDGTFLGTPFATLRKGRATFTKVVFQTAGNYTLTATPDTNSTLAITSPVSADVSIIQGTTSPIARPSLKATYTFGKALTFSVTLRANISRSIPFTGTPTLIVSGNDNLAIPATTFTPSGKAKFAIPVLHPGEYTCQIVYDGDINHSSSTSLPRSFTVKPAASTVTLVATPTSLLAGQTLTLTAVVKSSSAPAIARTGAIQFFDNSTLIETIALDASSSVTLILSPTSAGSHVYRAFYLGDLDFTASQSRLLTLSVR